jgi:hypothetical protein
MREIGVYRSEDNEKPSSEHISRLKGLDEHIAGKEYLRNSLLVGTSHKRGTDINISSLDPYNTVREYAEIMTETGADVIAKFLDEDHYSARVFATRSVASTNEFEQILDPGSELDPEMQKKKARKRGYPEESIEWFHDEEILTIVPSKLRGLFECPFDERIPINFAIKADQNVFDRYVRNYGVPRIDTLRELEKETGHQFVRKGKNSEWFWERVRNDELPYDTTKLQEFLHEENEEI